MHIHVPARAEHVCRRKTIPESHILPFNEPYREMTEWNRFNLKNLLHKVIPKGYNLSSQKAGEMYRAIIDHAKEVIFEFRLISCLTSRYSSFRKQRNQAVHLYSNFAVENTILRTKNPKTKTAPIHLMTTCRPAMLTRK
jgi:hypothetical protein